MLVKKLREAVVLCEQKAAEYRETYSSGFPNTASGKTLE